ncbi:hypothetical protein PM082_018023 [Marasmius tenuissimus]|nr:hypothetical protein PM082_018023 [Marasmius tenuissimus]
MNYAIVVASSVLSLAVSVPLSGALVRWRVHYAPSTGRIRLEDSEGQEPSTPPVTGYFSTLRRVYRLEGWAGLYKGFSPTFFGAVFMMSILLSWLKITPG